MRVGGRTFRRDRKRGKAGVALPHGVLQVPRCKDGDKGALQSATVFSLEEPPLCNELEKGGNSLLLAESFAQESWACR